MMTMLANGDRDLDESTIGSIHTVRVDEVLVRLGSQPGGLATSEVVDRSRRHGPNRIRHEVGRSIWLKLLANFTHLMAWLLWIGGAIAWIAQTPQLAVAVWMVNVINGIFAFWQEYRAEKATEALQQLLPAYARVLRDGQEALIPAEELVPGDILLLGEGDRVSADARLIQEAELRVDQSTLTGETHPLRKTSEAVLETCLARSDIPNLVFAGTCVAAGTGRAVVFATGMTTEFGKIAGLTQTLKEEPSPLQRELIVVTKVVTVIATGFGVLFFTLAVLLTGIDPSHGFVLALGMIVAFVPEGMLPTVTLSLAMGVQRMARRNALIKRLSAVETLGCTTVICTDKTGTLTQNEMTVHDLWVSGQCFTVSGVGYAPEGQIREGGRAVVRPVRDDLRLLLLAAGLCNNARLVPPGGAPDAGRWSILGDPTEAALLVAARKGGLDLDEEVKRAPRLGELPFDSHRRRMTTIHELRGTEELQTSAGSRSGGRFRRPSTNLPRLRRAYVKGAPGDVLALSTRIWWQGQELPLADAQRREIIQSVDHYSRSGLRVLAVAMRDLPPGQRREAVTSRPRPASATEGLNSVEQDLTFIGLITLYDPPRPEVTEAVQRCHSAGIRIIMITGDYGLTAESIARRIGIIRRGQRPRVLTSTDLELMSDAELLQHLTGEILFARVTPEHKLRVVKLLQDMGQVVAVTGDGVNDAPALKKANIGVAMGLVGTDVAKEAADMILADDNFASIVNAIEEGRAVYANIKKFMTLIFTSNFAEAVPFVAFAISGGRIPLALNVMQILSVDLGADIVPALALGAEPPEPGIMAKPPRSLKEHVITGSLLKRAFVLLGPLQALLGMAAFYFCYWSHGFWGKWLDLPASGPLYAMATSMTLGTVVMTQVGNLLAQRTELAPLVRVGLFSNRLVWIGAATAVVVVGAVVTVPPLQWVFGTAALPLNEWLLLVALSPALLVADELYKMVLRAVGKRPGR